MVKHCIEEDNLTWLLTDSFKRMMTWFAFKILKPKERSSCHTWIRFHRNEKVFPRGTSPPMDLPAIVNIKNSFVIICVESNPNSLSFPQSIDTSILFCTAWCGQLRTSLFTNLLSFAPVVQLVDDSIAEVQAWAIWPGCKNNWKQI